MRLKVYTPIWLISIFTLFSSRSLAQDISTIAGDGSTGYAGDGGAATAARVSVPLGVVVDASGNVYVADYGNYRVRMISTSGVISTYAGSGSSSFSGDGGAATAAGISPWGLAMDVHGNLYISDIGNNRVRKVTTGGVISTIAGTGASGFSGDGGAATAAIFDGPTGIAVDSVGNVYLCDESNNRIRKVSTSGTVTTIAGTGVAGYSGDGGAATAAEVNYPIGIAIDTAGNIYIGDQSNHRVRRINTAGTISTFAGSGSGGFSGDGGAATAAEFDYPTGIAFDAYGNVYIADPNNSNVRKVNTAGTISTIAGDEISGFSGDGGPATAAEMYNPNYVAFDASGNLYISDEGNNRVRKVALGCALPSAGSITGSFTLCGTGSTTLVDSATGGTWSSSDSTVATVSTSGVVTGVAAGTTTISYTVSNSCGTVSATASVTVSAPTGGGGIITTVAGSSARGYAGDGSAATAGELNFTAGVAVDASGNIYIADASNNRVRKVNTAGVLSTFAGDGSYGSSGDGSAATAASLENPQGVAVDGSGNVFIAEGGGNRIRKVNTAGVISTIAGTGTGGYSGDGGSATAAEIWYPEGVAVDGAGNVYIADALNQRIRKVSTSGIMSTIAGDGSSGYSGDGGAATAATMKYPYNVAVDASGNVYFADDQNNRVRKINTAGIISTIAGNGTAGYSGDGGAATAAELQSPWGVAVDGSGNVYIGDWGNNRVRKVNAAGVITTLAGDGTGGYSGDGGAATAAELAAPWGVALDATGNVYIADYDNSRIRKVSASIAGAISGITGSDTICMSAAATLSDSVSGGMWSSSNPSVVGVTGGVIEGLSVGSATITYAVAGSCGTSSATKTITVIASGAAGSITGTTMFCDSTETTLSDTALGGVWSSGDTTIATINSSGMVTAVRVGSATVFYTVATSVCGTASATTTVVVLPKPTVDSITGITTLCPGTTTTLSEGATTGSWSSSSTSVATVAGGVVNGLSAGTTTISYTVSSTCGVASTSIGVTVNPLTDAGSIAGIDTVCVGGHTTLTDGTTGGMWSSSDGGVATVDSGVVSGVSSGSAVIYYSVSGVCGIASATASVVVMPGTTIGSITGIKTICPGTTTTLSDSSAGGTWTISDSVVASISGGALTGLSAGTATVSYTISGGCGSVSTSAGITVAAVVTPVVTRSGDTLTATGGYTSYQWLLSGSPISGATDSSYVMHSNGNYSVVTENTAGCTDTSSVLGVTNLAVNPLSTARDITVYPNPAQSVVYISSQEPVDVRLTTLEGRMVQEAKQVRSMDISHIASGGYMLEVYDRQGIRLKTVYVVKTE
jgi:uncharacterized protein YjdB